MDVIDILTATDPERDARRNHVGQFFEHYSSGDDAARARAQCRGPRGKPVNVSTMSTTRIVSRYPIAPVVTFVALLYTYSALALVVVAWACFLSSDSIVIYLDKGARTQNVLQMAQLRLMDPLAVVAESFMQRGSDGVTELGETAPDSWKRTLETDVLDMFEPDDHREIAPQISRTASGNIQFGHRKRYAMLSVSDADAEN